MDKNITDTRSIESGESKKAEEIINSKVAKDEIVEEESKRDKIFNRVSQKINSLVSKKETEGGKTNNSAKEGSIGKVPLSWKKLLPFSPLLIIIILAIYVQFFAKQKIAEESVNLPPTPTYSPFPKYKPSIYADDPVVIRLEETLNVLDREISTTPLTESTLTPPVLDFNIGF